MSELIDKLHLWGASRKFLAMILMCLMSGVAFADLPPMSFDEWRGHRRGSVAFRIPDEAPMQAFGGVLRLKKDMSCDGGIPNAWFYAGFLVLAIAFVFCIPRGARRRTRIELWSLAGASSLAVVVSHHNPSPELAGMAVGLLFLVNAITSLVALIWWMAKLFQPHYSRLLLCCLVLAAMTGVGVLEFGSKIMNSFSTAYHTTDRREGGIGDAPTEEDRKAYEQYLWSRSHCTRCGTALSYYQGRYCPKCNPKRQEGTWRTSGDESPKQFVQ